MNNAKVIEDFIKGIVEELTSINESYIWEDKTPIDIPYVIAPLVQRLSDEKFKEFISDISEWTCNFTYEEINEVYSRDYGKLSISLYKEISTQKHISNRKHCDYTYSIIFTDEERDWGYCECQPTDKDYREDKKCCGHGCDCSAPAFRIVKESMIGFDNWQGDQHDYWEFKDAFYKSDSELSEEKLKRDKEEKVKYLQEQIKRMQDELANM